MERAKLKKIIMGLGLLGIVLVIILASGADRAYSAPSCKLVPVGQIPERILEIQKELIFIFTAAEKEYVNILELAPQLTELSKRCLPPEAKCKIQVNMCPALCEPDKCELLNPCEPIDSNDQDLCDTPWEPGSSIKVKDKIDEVFSKIEKSKDNINALAGHALKLVAELSVLKWKLAQAKNDLNGFDPSTEFMHNCLQAKSIGLVSGCAPKGRLFGLPLPLLFNEAQSSFDYLICGP